MVKEILNYLNNNIFNLKYFNYVSWIEHIWNMGFWLLWNLFTSKQYNIELNCLPPKKMQNNILGNCQLHCLTSGINRGVLIIEGTERVTIIGKFLSKTKLKLILDVWVGVIQRYSFYIENLKHSHILCLCILRTLKYAMK